MILAGGLVVALGSWLAVVPNAGAAPADVGVGISAQPIELAESAHPGETYSLGPVTVVNTGTEPATIELRIAGEPSDEGRAVPTAWVRFERDSLRLAGGEQAAIGVRLAVPDGAASGRYQSLLFAGSAPEADRGSNRLGAEAATHLAFTVEEPAAGAGQPLNRSRLLIVAFAAFVSTAAANVVLAVRRSLRRPSPLLTTTRE